MPAQILDFSETNGLVLCNKSEIAQNNHERLYLFELTKLNAYAVFFRRFFNSNDDIKPYKSEPSVCFFLAEDVPINSKQHFDIHAALWSEGKIDIYIILKGNTRLDIYNVKKPAEKIGEKLSLESLILASDSLRTINKVRFSAKLFGQGTFWEQKENSHCININRSPYRHLVDYLMNVRKQFNESEECNLNQETIDKLLVLTILIKFLEEKKDTVDDKSTLDEIYIKYSIKSVEDINGGSELISIIEDLSNEFNGRIFDQFNQTEKLQIRDTNLSLLSNFLKANVDIKSGQHFLWRQYSFQHLPAEVISAIYENFIQVESLQDGNGREKGVVYTPIHLVNFLIDEVMPLDNPPASFINKFEYKILDPACGSGVFLVAAFKRMLQWWAILESQKTGQILYPDVSIAKKILETNIYGVDVKATAVRVSIFGLTTALLDFLTPKQVWSKLKFKDLTYRNIVHAVPPTGFFQWAVDAKNQGLHFSLAIGNPPFNPEKRVKKDLVLDENIIQVLNLKQKKIPRKNFALHFFETAMLLSDNICMIIPSNVFLYDKSITTMKYRESLFKEYSISHIYDLTHLRRELFTNVDIPVVVVVGKNVKSNFQPIIHTVIKRTVASEHRYRFEIDEYDIHRIKWDWAVNPEKHFIWKANLLGGGRLFHLIERLQHSNTIEKFIDSKRKQGYNWLFQDGYKNLSKYPISPVIHYLYNQDKIVGIDKNANAIIEGKVGTPYFGRPRPEELYEPPLIIIHKKSGGGIFPVAIIKSYHNKYIAFSNSFLGIHCPTNQSEELNVIFSLLKENNNLSLFWMIATSSNTLINQETTINKEDVASIPLNLATIKIENWEQILIDDVMNYYIHFGKAISKSSSGAILHKSTNKKQFEDYGNVLCAELNDIYERNDNCWQIGKVFTMESFTVYQIGFGSKGCLKNDFIKGELDKRVEELINNEVSNRGATFRRLVRLYDHIDGFDCVYFIKPNSLRYWLKSIAIRDADETFLELSKEGY